MSNSVKLLLKESIKNVGRVGDVVEVSAGYARNYLLPNDLAVQPTPGNVKKIEARRQEVLKLEQEKRAGQAEMLKKMEGVEVTLERRANDAGHLFGSVSATDISKALEALGYEIDPDDINLPGKLDRIEKYTVTIALAEDLKTDIKVWVAPDAESKADIEAARHAREEAHKAEKAIAERTAKAAKDAVEKGDHAK